MLIAGGVAFCFGLLEFWLNTLLFPAVFDGRFGKTGGLIAAKLAVYGLGITLLLVWFRSCVVPAAIGFGAGFMVFMIAYMFMKLIRKDE